MGCNPLIFFFKSGDHSARRDFPVSQGLSNVSIHDLFLMGLWAATKGLIFCRLLIALPLTQFLDICHLWLRWTLHWLWLILYSGFTLCSLWRPRPCASSQALSDTVAKAYRELMTETGDYNKWLTTLKNRLSKGRNWHGAANQFSADILAVIPIDGDFNIHDHK
jgi:hypothetical protein